MTPLLFAIDQNQDEIIQLLLSNKFCKMSDKIDVNKKSVKTIFDKDIEIFEKTPLYMSVEKRNINAIRSLLARADIDVNEKSVHISGNDINEQKAPLHLASEIGDIEIIKLLLEKKEVDINIEDDQGKKPIDYSENQEIKYLLSK